MEVFMNHNVDEVVEEFRKYQFKWLECPQKYCIFHGDYTNCKMYDERCKECTQPERGYQHYASE